MRDSVKKVKRKWRITFILAVAAITFSSAILVAVLKKILFEWGGVPEEAFDESVWYVLFSWVLANVVIGSVMALFAGKFVMKSANQLTDGLARLVDGDYAARLEFDEESNLKFLSDSFNKLAVELQKTEILRSDFVNEFSHEFKTPISSINGLIGIMKRENLSEEKRGEYLDVIEEETNRLSSITTNVLNLSKIESQGILTDVRRFNVSEQIRDCVLLLEKKWLKKNLEPIVELDEFFVYGNEDMLKQVWINLLDNAIKFSQPNGELRVFGEAKKEGLRVSIVDFGVPIESGEEERIFKKFYRGERAKGLEGNGIGLSIVKHAVELHGGEIFAESKDGATQFTVFLPTDAR